MFFFFLNDKKKKKESEVSYYFENGLKLLAKLVTMCINKNLVMKKFKTFFVWPVGIITKNRGCCLVINRVGKNNSIPACSRIKIGSVDYESKTHEIKQKWCVRLKFNTLICITTFAIIF